MCQKSAATVVSMHNSPKLSLVDPIVLQHYNEDELSANSPTSLVQGSGSMVTELLQNVKFQNACKDNEIHFFFSVSIDNSYSLKTGEVTNSQCGGIYDHNLINVIKGEHFTSGRYVYIQACTLYYPRSRR